MFDKLQDILIINNSGRVLVSKIKNPNIQDDLFGMLFSALNIFTEEVFKNQLQKIEMNNIRFDFLQKNNLIFIVTSSKKDNPKKVQKDLEVLSDIFFSKYSADKLEIGLENVDIFTEFENELKKKENNPILEFLVEKGKGFN